MQNRESLLRLLVVSLLVYMLCGYTAARGRLNEARRQETELEQTCAVLREENEDLQRRLAAAGEDEAIEAMAREKLGLVMPGESVFYFD